MQFETIGNGGALLLEHRNNLQHLLNVASQLVHASAAALVLVRDSTSRVLQSTHPESLNASFRWANDHMPYHPERSHVITNVADLELSRAIRSILGSYRTGFLVRVPVIVEAEYTVALLLHSSETQPAPDRHAMSILRPLARSMARDARFIARELIHADANSAVLDTFDEFLDAVLRDEGLHMVFATDGELLASSRGIRAIGLPEADPHSKLKHFDNLPCADSLRLLANKVLDTGASSPEVDIHLNVFGEQRSVATRINLVRPLDSDESLLEVRMLPIGWNLKDIQQQTTKADQNFLVGTAETFLMDTLLHKRTIRSRHQSSFVTLRSWRSSLKKHQIAALRTIKRHDPHNLGEMAGNECAAEFEHLVGLGTFKYIVPVPCGHSPPDKCLSAAIAHAMGAKLNVPVVNAFAHLEQTGSSHPKTNIMRPSMRQIQIIPGPAIIVDDVTTSGSHLLEASTLLKQSGSHSFSMAWIGGDAP